MPLSPGQMLNNRYQIIQLLREGGFGSVYLALDSNLNEQVAVKESDEISADAQRQFQFEARLLFRLVHPNLPRVHDHFVIPGQGMYLVMDYIEGEDLETMVEGGGPIPQENIVGWIEQICDALSYLHSQNPAIIHRDIKPANIKITSQGKAVLVDFGIAKYLNPSSTTTHGAKAASPGFSPPEQYSYESTDALSDIYSLGATMYYLCTGLIPPDANQIISGMAEPPTPAHLLNPSISPYISTVLDKAMQLRRDQRFTSAADFKAALNPSKPRYPSSPKVQAPQPTRGLSKMVIIGAVAATMCLGASIIIAGGFLWSNYVAASKASQSAIVEPSSQPSDTAPTAPPPTPTIYLPPPIIEPTRPQAAMEPDEFIRAYYDAINRRDYSLSWSMLSTNFKNKHNASGYDPYVAWWDSIERVEVLSAQIQDQSEDTAILLVELRYTYKTGRVVDDNASFQLIQSSWEYGWLIDA